MLRQRPCPSTREAAALLGLSPRTLERYRVTGEGPEFSKLGGRVCNARADIDGCAPQGRRPGRGRPWTRWSRSGRKASGVLSMTRRAYGRRASVLHSAVRARYRSCAG